MTSKVLTYKGQIGSVDWDTDSDCMFGQLLYIKDLVTYEACSPGELKKEFEAAVDDYLETCEALGEEPNKPFKGTFNVRIGSDLHKRLSFKAAELGISVNDAVTRAVSDFVDDAPSSSDLLSDVHDHLKQYVYEYQSMILQRRPQQAAHITPAKEPSVSKQVPPMKGSSMIVQVKSANGH